MTLTITLIVLIAIAIAVIVIMSRIMKRKNIEIDVLKMTVSDYDKAIDDHREASQKIAELERIKNEKTNYLDSLNNNDFIDAINLSNKNSKD